MLPTSTRPVWMPHLKASRGTQDKQCVVLPTSQRSPHKVISFPRLPQRTSHATTFRDKRRTQSPESPESPESPDSRLMLTSGRPLSWHHSLMRRRAPSIFSAACGSPRHSFVLEKPKAKGVAWGQIVKLSNAHWKHKERPEKTTVSTTNMYSKPSWQCLKEHLLLSLSTLNGKRAAGQLKHSIKPPRPKLGDAHCAAELRRCTGSPSVRHSCRPQGAKTKGMFSLSVNHQEKLGTKTSQAPKIPKPVENDRHGHSLWPARKRSHFLGELHQFFVTC